jgi:HAD superfamily hydrolase (TIGR01549 family)
MANPKIGLAREKGDNQPAQEKGKKKRLEGDGSFNQGAPLGTAPFSTRRRIYGIQRFLYHRSHCGRTFHSRLFGPGLIQVVIEAVIFDIDGTIVDSVALHAKAWQRAFAKFGKNILLEDIRSQIGKGADQLLPVYLSEQELERFGEAIETYRGELFKSEYLPKVKAFPKVRELFDRIKQDNKQIALASSAKQEELRAYKEIAGIDELVENETSADNVTRSKPCPDIYHAALEELGNPDPDGVIAIGDTPYDAVAAANAKIKCIGLLSGGWMQAQLRRAGCIAIYRDPADLLARYEDSPIAPGAVTQTGSD